MHPTFHMKHKILILLLSLPLILTACADPMPIYASYQPIELAPEDEPSLEHAPPEEHAHTAPVVDEAARMRPQASSSPPLPPAQPQALARASADAQEPAQAPEQGSEPARINLNTATQAQLETLPGVGPSTAKKIMDYRARRPFTRTSQLRHIKGIGAKTYRRLAPLVTTEATP